MGHTRVLAAARSTEMSTVGIDEVYRRFAPAIHRRCRAMLADDDEALDALHDIFLRLYDKLSTFRGDSELMTWLYRLSTNHCLNRLRARRTRERIIDAAGRTQPTEAPSLSAEVERRDLLRRLLGAFDEDHVQLAVHYYYDEMTQPEIARVLGVSERTVRTRLRKIEELAERQRLELERIRGGGAP
jgi:RNA polymerase sigma-70 factor (ECF subfamily)